MVDTFRIVRRQQIDATRWRENGELLPEAHAYVDPDHLEHTGEIVAAPGVDEAEFRAAVAEYCPSYAEVIFENVGLGEGTPQASGAPRLRPMLPQTVPEHFNAETAHDPAPAYSNAYQAPAAAVQDHTTIMATDIWPGTTTPEIHDHPNEMESTMAKDGENGLEVDGGGESRPGYVGPAAENVYEDHTTLDPVTENELIGGTSPEALKQAKKGVEEITDKDGHIVVPVQDAVTDKPDENPPGEKGKKPAEKRPVAKKAPAKKAPAKAPAKKASAKKA